MLTQSKHQCRYGYYCLVDVFGVSGNQWEFIALSYRFLLVLEWQQYQKLILICWEHFQPLFQPLDLPFRVFTLKKPFAILAFISIYCCNILVFMDFSWCFHFGFIQELFLVVCYWVTTVWFTQYESWRIINVYILYSKEHNKRRSSDCGTYG